MQTIVASSSTERTRRTLAAWERFVGGDDDVEGVPALILLSWQRSRDVYRVDPLEAAPPRAVGQGSTSLLQDSVITQLGGIAAGLADTVDGALTTVTDGCGRVLASWGAGDVQRRAAAINLAPMYTWAESAAGTNGMGTALGRERPVSVRGPEHWCACLHDWTCTGISISDVVTGLPFAVLNVSSWRGGSSGAIPARLEQAVASIRCQLHSEAQRQGAELVAAFTAAAASAARDQSVLVADVAGNVIAANEAAHKESAQMESAQKEACSLPAAPVLDPGERRRFRSARLREVVAEARVQAGADPLWSEAFRVDVLRDERAFTVRPIHFRCEFIGIVLVSTTAADGADGLETPEPVCGPPSAAEGMFRLSGICENRLIVLAPREIRYAEADRHAVWLVTDRGRVRATERGLDNVESQLRRFGFLRVHRSFLVNVHRVQEVEQGLAKGTLTVSTRHHGAESIPVARRHVARLRAALGI